MLNSKHRIVKDIEIIGAGFIKERVIKRTPFKEVCEGPIMLPDGTAVKVIVEYRHGHGTVLGPATNNTDNYDRLDTFLNDKENDIKSGYALRLRKRELGELIEKVAVVVATLTLMANPINQFVSHIIIDNTGLSLIAIWIASLIAINKVAWYQKRRR